MLTEYTFVYIQNLMCVCSSRALGGAYLVCRVFVVCVHVRVCVCVSVCMCVCACMHKLKGNLYVIVYI